MDDRKQYAKKVVVSIIEFMALASTGVKPPKVMMDAIPEELHGEIITSLMAAREVRRISVLKSMSEAFPLNDILEKAMKQAEEGMEG